jgi:hypothetical protein
MLRITLTTVFAATTLLPSLATATEANILTCTVGSKQLSLTLHDKNIIYNFGPAGQRKQEIGAYGTEGLDLISGSKIVHFHCHLATRR